MEGRMVCRCGALGPWAVSMTQARADAKLEGWSRCYTGRGEDWRCPACRIRTSASWEAPHVRWTAIRVPDFVAEALADTAQAEGWTLVELLADAAGVGLEPGGTR